MACHPGGWKGPINLVVFIGIFGLLLEGWNPPVKQVPGIYIFVVNIFYMRYIHIFLYE